MKPANILEEEIKNKVAQNFFSKFDCTKILGKIDFAVKLQRKNPNLLSLEDSIGFNNSEYLLWAEAKQKNTDILVMLTQLVLTIGRARTFDEILPPPFLGCYDNEKIAFVPYHEVQDIFYQNDFNWNVTPSNHETKEFRQVYDQIKKIVDNDIPWETYIFDFKRDEKDLRRFIRENFVLGKAEISKIKIDKNNFIIIYNKWLETVKPSIQVNWDIAKKNGIIDGDFYLADLLASENVSLKEKLFVLLKSNYYEANRRIDESGMFASSQVYFSDSQKAHTVFWNKYERPPREEYWDYIVNRRDLLVPQDVRERKGSFFTPQIWVELSQRYIADVLGEDWQDEYYVWDCAAGTGNLLAGLTNKYNIWASTLDRQDVDVMRDRIENGANLLKDHVFQFDFLNDDFTKLPEGLKKIIDSPSERKKLIIYINPPYAEAATTSTVTGTGENKTDVAAVTKIYQKYQNTIGIAGRELFAQFFTRIYCEIPGVTLAEFSTLKILQAPNFENFKNMFQAKLKNMFVVPADTFDNVKGKFPIGFFIWDTSEKESFTSIKSDVYNEQSNLISTKEFSSYINTKSINDWLISTRNRINEKNIGFISCKGNDFQNANLIFIINDKRQLPHPRGTWITDKNIIEAGIYYSVRHCIEATWLNDRDQFLYPNEEWKNDKEFQNDCLVYTLFNNNIQSKYGVNHWIPFTEREVNARDKFESNFMTNFISGKKTNSGGGSGSHKQINMFMLFEPEIEYQKTPMLFSKEAGEVFDAGRKLWRYYHAVPNCNVNASLYDIREHFQGRNESGKMNNISTDERYNELIGNLRNSLRALAKKIEPKVYAYGFLRK
ncbi:hypothetical protein FACS189432_07610 [Bacteroidia bacterium]|nr:hypothetical protein FACS189432_07610 [Bacteroidia bacterium]GHV70605.1 hypothetical protein FACS189420_2390 [Bacteroidia bacterium]